MRKLVIIIVFVVVCINTAMAQKKVGQFSFIPRVGLNLGNIGGMEISDVDNVKHKSVILPDFMLGADVEYQLLKPLGVSLGAYYSRQGCRWSTYYVAMEALPASMERGFEDQSMKLQYINIPLNVKYYINEYFSVHAGVQAGIYLNGSYDYTTNDITIDSKTGERTYGVATKNHQDMDNLANSLVWAVPVGISLEYEHAIVDVSYSFPVSSFAKSQSAYSEAGGNRVWTISVGYRL